LASNAKIEKSRLWILCHPGDNYDSGKPAKIEYKYDAHYCGQGFVDFSNILAVWRIRFGNLKKLEKIKII
jgi:hypothetical protein